MFLVYGVHPRYSRANLALDCRVTVNNFGGIQFPVSGEKLTGDSMVQQTSFVKNKLQVNQEPIIQPGSVTELGISRWQNTEFTALAKESAESTEAQQLLRQLFPLFPSSVPTELTIFSTVPDPKLHTNVVLDAINPVEVAENISVEDLNKISFTKNGTFDEMGKFVPYQPVELDIKGQKVWATRIIESTGPSSLNYFQLTQHAPNLVPEAKGLEIITECDGKFNRYPAEEFFKSFGPFSKAASEVGANTSIIPIAAEKHFGLYLRALYPIKIYPNGQFVSPITGWFSGAVGHYDYKQQVVTMENVSSSSNEILDRLGTILEESKSSPDGFTKLSTDLYGERATVENVKVDLQIDDYKELQIKKDQTIVGLRLEANKDSLTDLSKIQVELTYNDGKSVNVPLLYLFGALAKDSKDLVITDPSGKTFSYQSIYFGIIQKSNNELVFYSNLPMVGVRNMSFKHNDSIALTLNLSETLVETKHIPQSLAQKRFVPVFNNNKFVVGDYIIIPPTHGRGIVGATYVDYPDWVVDHSAPESPFSRPNAKTTVDLWMMGNMETSMDEASFVRDEKTGLYTLRLDGGFMGGEDTFGGFYDPDPSNPLDQNVNLYHKGSVLTGGFTYSTANHLENPAETKTRNGVAFYLKLPTDGKMFFLKRHGDAFSFGDGQPMVKLAEVGSLSMQYLDQNTPLPQESSLSQEIALLDKTISDSLGSEKLDQIPVLNMHEATVRYNLEAMALAVKSGNELTNDQREYLQKAGQFYGDLIKYFDGCSFFDQADAVVSVDYYVNVEIIYYKYFGEYPEFTPDKQIFENNIATAAQKLAELEKTKEEETLKKVIIEKWGAKNSTEFVESKAMQMFKEHTYISFVKLPNGTYKEFFGNLPISIPLWQFSHGDYQESTKTSTPVMDLSKVEVGGLVTRLGDNYLVVKRTQDKENKTTNESYTIFNNDGTTNELSQPFDENLEPVENEKLIKDLFSKNPDFAAGIDSFEKLVAVPKNDIFKLKEPISWNTRADYSLINDQATDKLDQAIKLFASLENRQKNRTTGLVIFRGRILLVPLPVSNDERVPNYKEFNGIDFIDYQGSFDVFVRDLQNPSWMEIQPKYDGLVQGEFTDKTGQEMLKHESAVALVRQPGGSLGVYKGDLPLSVANWLLKNPEDQMKYADKTGIFDLTKVELGDMIFRLGENYVVLHTLHTVVDGDASEKSSETYNIFAPDGSVRHFSDLFDENFQPVDEARLNKNVLFDNWMRATIGRGKLGNMIFIPLKDPIDFLGNSYLTDSVTKAIVKADPKVVFPSLYLPPETGIIYFFDENKRVDSYIDYRFKIGAQREKNGQKFIFGNTDFFTAILNNQFNKNSIP